MVNMLLNCSGLNKKNVNKIGQNAVHVAVQSGKLDMLKLVTQGKGAVPQEPDKKGMLPLHIAVLMNNFEAVQHLVEKVRYDDSEGVVNKGQNEDFTPVHYACHKGNFEILQYLLEHKGDLMLTSKKGVTCLHLSCGSGMLDMARYLIEV